MPCVPSWYRIPTRIPARTMWLQRCPKSITALLIRHYGVAARVELEQLPRFRHTNVIVMAARAASPATCGTRFCFSRKLHDPPADFLERRLSREAIAAGLVGL